MTAMVLTVFHAVLEVILDLRLDVLHKRCMICRIFQCPHSSSSSRHFLLPAGVFFYVLMCYVSLFQDVINHRVWDKYLSALEYDS